MKLGQFFETKTRDDGKKFVTLADDRPDWLYDAVYEAHQSDAPNDWIFAECEAACDAIDDGTLSDDDSVHEYADGRVDVYTRELYQWAADMCLSDTFAAAESDDSDLGTPENDSTVDRLMRLQYHAIARIARIMLEAAEDQPEE